MHETIPAPGTRKRELRRLLDDYERMLIRLALDATRGNQRRAAASLGIQPSTLSEKMRRLGLRADTRLEVPGERPPSHVARTSA